jgi:RNA polymerase sigma factor (TIGR02999 family)
MTSASPGLVDRTRGIAGLPTGSAPATAAIATSAVTAAPTARCRLVFLMPSSSPPEAGTARGNWQTAENGRKTVGRAGYNHLIPDSRSSHEVTGLLLAWGKGDQAALEQLVPLVHGELRRIARRHMGHERVGHTLQPTALVNEAYMKLVDIRKVQWQNRAHFFAMSARLMRRILVDFARSRHYQKRGGGAQKVTLDEGLLSTEKGDDLLALDEALTALAAVDPRKSQVVEMRFFGGLSVEETAQALHVSVDTVMRDWKLAKVWLLREIKRR